MPGARSRARPPARVPRGSGPSPPPARAVPRAAMERIEGAAVGRCADSPYLRPLTLHYRQVSPPARPPRLPRLSRPPRPAAPGPAPARSPAPAPQTPPPPPSAGRVRPGLPARSGTGAGRNTSGDHPFLKGSFAGYWPFVQWDVAGAPRLGESFLEVAVSVLGRRGRGMEGEGRRRESW